MTPSVPQAPARLNRPVKPIYKGEDWTGRQIGSWTVLGDADYLRTPKGGRYRWLCRCSCGTESWLNTSTILYGRSLSCLPCRNRRAAAGGEDNHNWKGFKEIPGEVLQKIKIGAKRGRELPVEITCEDLYDQWIFQARRCFYTGRLLTILKDASVDRIDSNLGYIRGNIEWVHKDVNKAKMALTKDDFIQLCREIAKNTENLYV